MAKAGGGMESFANRIWYGNFRLHLLLLPLTPLFAAVAASRRFLYRYRILKSYRIPVPVIVVGNITVGGSGKTPITLWVARELQGSGLNPAIISRGYGGTSGNGTTLVTAQSDPAVVGDEPVLLARRTDCPVYVNSNRVDAAEAAVSGGANIIVSDDGLQHYRLQRDAEIVVLDGERGLGNGHLLPAGPLREPEGRLESIDRILIQCEIDGALPRYGNRAFDRRTTRFTLVGDAVENVADGSIRPVEEFSGKTVHAVAGIANPDRFFRQLEYLGLDVKRHPLPDHAVIAADDIAFDDDLDVIVTEKDAVKCKAIAHERLWFLPVHAAFDSEENMQWAKSMRSKLMESVSGTAD